MGPVVTALLAIGLIIRLLSSSVRIRTIVLVCAAKYSLFVLVIAIAQSAGTIGSVGLEVVGFILIWTPTIVLRWVVVPLRMPRIAYWMVRLCWPLGLVRETQAGGIMYGALALARKGGSDEAIRWLAHRLHDVPRMRGAGVVAAGLLAALKKENELARNLLSIADTMERRLIPRSARVIARNWLVVDAARAGKWQRVIRLGRGRSIKLRWSYSMARIGERLTGDPRAWRDWRLWPCFLWAPRRRATYPLFRRALAVPARRPVQASPPPAVVALPLALGGLAHALGAASAHDGEALAQSIGAVDRQLDSMRGQIEQRLNALGGRSDAGSVLSAFRQQLTDLPTPVIEDNPHLARAAQRGSMLEQAAWQVRRRLFGDVEARCKDYRERTVAASSLDLATEWESWAMLKGSAEQLLELDPNVEDTLFHTVYAPACNFAAFQHNGRKRIALAHDMFGWLLRHARSDPQAQQLLTKNLQAGKAVI
jgi:hypothetical protein